MLVKCQGCGNRIEKSEAFRIVIKDKPKYYCNAIEFDAINVEKEARIKVIDLTNEMLNTTNTAVYKELTNIANVHTYKKLLNYMENNLDMLINSIDNKHFSSEYGKIRYLMAIVKNEIGDYKEPVPMVDEIVNIVDEVEQVKYKTVKKKSFLDYLDEY